MQLKLSKKYIIRNDSSVIDVEIKSIDLLQTYPALGLVSPAYDAPYNMRFKLDGTSEAGVDYDIIRDSIDLSLASVGSVVLLYTGDYYLLVKGSTIDMGGVYGCVEYSFRRSGVIYHGDVTSSLCVKRIVTAPLPLAENIIG